MWCPDGYVTWYEISDELANLSFEALEGNIPLKTEGLDKAYRIHFYEAVKSNAWQFFLEECKSFSVCSSSGLLLRASGRQLGLRCESSPSITWPSQFLYINKITGLINIEVSKLVFAEADRIFDFHTTSYPVEFSDQVTISEDDFYMVEDIIAAKEYISAAEKFDGWAVCCKEQHRPQKILLDFVEFHKNYKFRRDETIKTIDYREYGVQSTGRPRKQEAAAQAYRTHFPDGHGNLTWKQVALELTRVGVAASPITLKRGLSQG